MRATSSDVRFRAYPRFNDPQWLAGLNLKRRLHTFPAAWFEGEGLPERLARSLAEARVVHLKELLESFEFFHRVRRRVRRPTVVDLCAGHGLTGLLFALCEPTVTRVILMDSARPATQAAVMQAVAHVGPWVADKVMYREQGLDAQTTLPAGAGVVAVHACGELTDLALAAAVRAAGPVALMPCCYSRAKAQALPGLRRALSAEVACDVARSYRLDAASYHVEWTAVPSVITPKHRILVGSRAH